MSGFCEKTNSLFSQMQAEANPQKKRDRAQELVVEVWKELNSTWAKKYHIEDFSDVIIATTRNCLEKFDPQKGGDFCHYLLAALSNELKKAERKDYQKPREKEVQIEPEILDIIEKSSGGRGELSQEEKALLLDKLEADLTTIEAALQNERENADEKAALMTLLILELLDKVNFCGIERQTILGLSKKHKFLDNRVWKMFFSKRTLPPRAVVAAKICKCSENTANAMLSRFCKRLKKAGAPQT